MGGDFYGAGWCHVFTEPELQVFTIPVAEFTAAVLHLHFIEGMIPDAKCVVMDIDALASPGALARRARSSGMVAAHEEFMACPIYRRFM